MYKHLKIATLVLGVVLSFSNLSAQDLFVGTGSNMYLGTDAVVSISGNMSSEENISGTNNARISLIGNSNTTLNMKNSSVHGLDIQKTSGNTVTLLDSFGVNNLYLTSGKLLLNTFAANVNTNMNNNASSIIQGTGNLKFNYATANADTLLLDQTTPGNTNQLVDLYVRGYASITLGDYVNIKRLAYIGATSTLASSTSTPYIKMVATDATNYGQLQFETGATLTGSGTSEMVNTHSASYIHLGTPYTGSNFSELTDDVTIFFNSTNGGKGNQWNLFTFNEELSSKSPGIGQNSFWNAVNSESDNFTRGEGYALYTWASGTAGVSLPISYPNTIDVSGTFTTANFVHTATFNTSTNTNFTNSDSAGWHLVTNPYYCNINVPTLPTGIQGQEFYIYESTNGSFKLKGFDTKNGTAINGGKRFVAPMQTLYYQATTGGATVTFNPSWQESTPSNNYNQWKSAPVTDQIRLTAQSNTNKNTDEAILGFMGTAKDGFGNEDARKVNNGYTYPNIFTYSDDNRLAFNYLNTITDETTIPVGFSAVLSGSYNIKATNEEQEHVNTMILEDKKEKTFTDLSFGSNYTFDHDASNIAERFVLHLKKTNSTSGITDIENNSFNIYTADNNISINFNTTNNENITVNIYDMLGREMTNAFEGNVSSKKLNFSTSDWSPAYYLVSLKIGTETKITKVLVK